MIGSVVSTKVITCVAVVVLPQSSVTLHVRVNMEPHSRSCVLAESDTVGASVQLSVAKREVRVLG